MMVILDNWEKFSRICELINLGDKEIVFSNIPNKAAKDFLQICMKDDPEDWPTVTELLGHKFLTDDPKENDMNSFKINTEFIQFRLYEKKRIRLEKEKLHKQCSTRTIPIE